MDYEDIPITHSFLTIFCRRSKPRNRPPRAPAGSRSTSSPRTTAAGLLGAVPCYLKSHSQGEYVFDHGWADAYERAGGSYYPKLQVCVPFTPATGPRLLVRPGPQAAVGPGRARRRSDRAVRAARGLVGACDLPARGRMAAPGRRRAFCSAPTSNSIARMTAMRASRISSSALSSRKRKFIRRERREALPEGITIHHLTGADLTEEIWDAFFGFYMDTGSRKWGRPYLTRKFFSLIGAKHAGAHPADHGEARRPLDRGRDQLHRRARRSTAAIGARSSIIPSCISRFAITRPSTTRSRMASSASKPARRASTSSRAAMCRSRPIPPITSPIRDCAARSPIISSASARMWPPPAKSLPPTRLSAKIRIGWGVTTMPAYDPNNIFAKILRGELPCHKVYEDDRAIAFLDIMPRAPGHTLVVPKSRRAQPVRRRSGRTRACRQGRAENRQGRRRRRSAPTASPSSNSTKAPADRSCSTCTSTSSRARKAWR